MTVVLTANPLRFDFVPNVPGQARYAHQPARYSERIAEADLVPAVGSKCGSHDNALAHPRLGRDGNLGLAVLVHSRHTAQTHRILRACRSPGKIGFVMRRPNCYGRGLP